ncbi:MAG: GNAT family N-acetyltransferase [Sulfitobacter sp.]
MIRQARNADLPALERFLSDHAATSMYLRGNLAAQGAEDRTHPYGGRYFMVDDPICGVFGLTNSGMMLVQLPHAPAPVWQGLAACLKGCTLKGTSGAPSQVKTALAALGLGQADCHLWVHEPLFHLTLADLPATQAKLRSPQPEDADLLQDWFTNYQLETGLSKSAADAAAEAQNRVARALGSADLGLLIEEGRPAAMAGISARLPDMVQIGGVYTPPPARGRGLGRRVTAAVLANAARQGATQAVLFANGPAAVRAYEAIGFRQIGQYQIALLHSPHVIGTGA